MSQLKYRGRFAPSPTGALHFGSLVAAVGSYLQARHNDGEWLVRIDNIDPPREVPGASEAILRTLEQYGFQWDGEVGYQLDRQHIYQEAVDELLSQKLAYFCSCSRKNIAAANASAINSQRYPGTCRSSPANQSGSYSTRLLSPQETMHFNDCIQGEQSLDIESTSGDFVLQRRDGYFSYHLACGIDDGELGITEVVRGSDLLEGTACQMHVQNSLGLNTPRYCHLPIVLNADGQKLSKQTHADHISQQNPIKLLCESLKFLGIMPPKMQEVGSIQEFWEWADIHWNITQVSKNAAQVQGD